MNLTVVSLLLDAYLVDMSASSCDVGRVKLKSLIARHHIPLQKLQLSQSNKRFRCSGLF
jgi:hypothetical protein